MRDDTLRALIDRNEIIDVFNRYATGIDRRDRDVYRACFVDDLEVDVAGVEALTGGASQWVDLAMSAVGGFETTQHIITNHEIQIAGDRATGVANLQAQHWNPDSAYVVGGYYTNDFRRTDQGWRMRRLQLTVTWTQNR